MRPRRRPTPSTRGSRPSAVGPARHGAAVSTRLRHNVHASGLRRRDPRSGGRMWSSRSWTGPTSSSLVSTLGLRPPVVVAEHNDPHEERSAPAWRSPGLTYRRARACRHAGGSAARYFALACVTRGGPEPGGRPSRPTRSTRSPSVPTDPGRFSRWAGWSPRRASTAARGLRADRDAPAGLDGRDPRWRGWNVRGPSSAAGLGLNGVASARRDPRPGRRLPRATCSCCRLVGRGFPTCSGRRWRGRAVVAFDCPSGPADLIRDDVDGILVPRDDIDALASAMAALIDDPARRSELGARAPEVAERFGLTAILGRWDELLTAVVPRRVGTPMSAASSADRDA